MSNILSRKDLFLDLSMNALTPIATAAPTPAAMARDCIG